jgi:thioredoxin-related protein
MPCSTWKIFTLIAVFGNLMGVASAESTTEKVVWRSSLKQAAIDSKNSNKPMLLQFTADWCGFCKKMYKGTFTDQRVISHVNACFIPISVDADQQEALAEAVGVEGLPTTVIVSPDLKVLKKFTGYLTPAELEEKLDTICQVKSETTSSTSRVQTASAQSPQIAFQEYCLVSLKVDRKLKKGSTEITSQFHKRTICFTSDENRKLFEANPSLYWPISDGFCPVTRKDSLKNVEGKPSFGVMYGNRPLFFANKTNMEKFSASPKSYIRAR